MLPSGSHGRGVFCFSEKPPAEQARRCCHHRQTFRRVRCPQRAGAGDFCILRQSWLSLWESCRRSRLRGKSINRAFGKQNSPRRKPGAQLVEKASQSLPPAGGKSSAIRFLRRRPPRGLPLGVYVAKNTSRSASVEFVRFQRTNYARGRLQAFDCQKRVYLF